MEQCKNEVVFFTKDKNNKIRVYTKSVNLKSEFEIKQNLSNELFLNESEEFYVIFDIKTS